VSLTLIDSEAAIRTWARSESHITAAVADRVFFATPQTYERTAPESWIVLSLVTETHQPGDVGFQRPLIQFTCYGRTKAVAADVALAVQAAGRSFVGRPVTVGPATIVAAEVSAKRWLPDPTTGTPRYVVDLLLAVRGAEAA